MDHRQNARSSSQHPHSNRPGPSRRGHTHTVRVDPPPQPGHHGMNLRHHQAAQGPSARRALSHMDTIPQFNNVRTINYRAALGMLMEEPNVAAPGGQAPPHPPTINLNDPAAWEVPQRRQSPQPLLPHFAYNYRHPPSVPFPTRGTMIDEPEVPAHFRQIIYDHPLSAADSWMRLRQAIRTGGRFCFSNENIHSSQYIPAHLQIHFVHYGLECASAIVVPLLHRQAERIRAREIADFRAHLYFKLERPDGSAPDPTDPPISAAPYSTHRLPSHFPRPIEACMGSAAIALLERDVLLHLPLTVIRSFHGIDLYSKLEDDHWLLDMLRVFHLNNDSAASNVGGHYHGLLLQHQIDHETAVREATRQVQRRQMYFDESVSPGREAFAQPFRPGQLRPSSKELHVEQWLNLNHSTLPHPVVLSNPFWNHYSSAAIVDFLVLHYSNFPDCLTHHWSMYGVNNLSSFQLSQQHVNLVAPYLPVELDSAHECLQDGVDARLLVTNGDIAYAALYLEEVTSHYASGGGVIGTYRIPGRMEIAERIQALFPGRLNHVNAIWNSSERVWLYTLRRMISNTIFETIRRKALVYTFDGQLGASYNAFGHYAL